MPETLATQLAVTTGPDGQATLNYLTAGDQLVAVRITAPSVGTQDLPLLESPRRNNQGATITIHLGATRRLAGRVRSRTGQPVAGQEVEVWSRGGTWLRMNPVVFQDGPVRTAADGSFRTPENLLVGSTYMLVVRAPGFEPVFSEMDHDRRATAALAAPAPEALANDSGAGRRSPGQGTLRRRGLSVG